jgi:hypothetical protein
MVNSVNPTQVECRNTMKTCTYLRSIYRRINDGHITVLCPCCSILYEVSWRSYVLLTEGTTAQLLIEVERTKEAAVLDAGESATQHKLSIYE